MCKKCSKLNVEVERCEGMRAAINKEVGVFCSGCDDPCEILNVGIGDVVYVNGKRVATIDMKTEKIDVDRSVMLN